MSDTTNHHVCTKCHLPCDTFIARKGNARRATGKEEQWSLCCNAPVLVQVAQ